MARAGWLVARVLHVRERGGRQVVLDAGMTELIRPALYGAHHPIVALTSLGRPSMAARRRRRSVRPTRVEGPICESTDSLGTHDLPPLRRGDLVAIADAGAYGVRNRPPTTAGPGRPGPHRGGSARLPAPSVAKVRAWTHASAFGLGWRPDRCWPTAGWAPCSSRAASRSGRISTSSWPTRPELIGAIHREYLAAGADLIETASFGANRLRLASYGLAAQASPLNRRAAQLAREARDVSGRTPGRRLDRTARRAHPRARAPAGDAAVRAAVREQIDGQLEGGVDLFLFETFSILDHLLLAIDEARSAASLPVVAQLTFGEDLELPDGTRPAIAAAALVAAGADVIGVNCGGGPEACVEALEAMNVPDGTELSIMPNAGLPQRIGGQFVYAASPEYLGAMVPRFLGRRCLDRGRLLRDDTRAHRGDARGPRRR